MLSPMQVGDAALGQMCEAAVFVVDHVMPRVSKYWFHWDASSDNLGPIIPEWAGDLHENTTSSSKATPPRAPAATA